MSANPDSDPRHQPQPPGVVIKSPQFEALIDALAAEMGTSTKSMTGQVESCLDEMCVQPSTTQSSQVIWRKLSSYMTRSYKVDVDDFGLSELRTLGQDASLIFLPNHKSYLDPIILRSTLSKWGFPGNYVLGGDNLAFWPMAPLTRRNGIVFIRREFKGDEVYKKTLRTYLAYLMGNNANLEWYIEGGRSRSGKLRPPRYGILSYVVDAFTSAGDETAYCVPVSITYDQQHEIGAISAEELGASKSPESVKWLFQFAGDQSRRLGRVHLRFGEPLSIGDAMTSVRDAEVLKAAEDGTPVPIDLDRYAVPKIAFELMHRINQVTPITPTSLVTFALLDNDDRALTVEEGASVLSPVLDYIAERGLPLTSDVETTATGGLYQSIKRLVREGVVERYDGGTEPVFRIAADRMHEAGFYRNSIAHHFLTRAMVELALVKVGEEGSTDVVGDTWREVKQLEDLLKYEFFFPTRSELAEAVAREVSLVVPDWEQEQWDPKTILTTLRKTPMHVAHRTIGPFLEAYEVVAILLANRAPSRPVDRKEFLDECIGVARQWWYQRQLHSPESISKNLFAGAMQLAGNRDLLGTGGEELRERRKAFADELSGAVRRVQVIRRMANEREGLAREEPKP